MRRRTGVSGLGYGRKKGGTSVKVLGWKNRVRGKGPRESGTLVLRLERGANGDLEKGKTT